MDGHRWKFVPLVERPEYKDECIALLNKEWPRSVVQRDSSIKRTLTTAPPLSLVLLRAEDDHLVGYAKLCNLPNDNEGCWVESVIIQHELRGMGYGRVLMDFIEMTAKSFSFAKVYLSTEDKEAFYRKCGYVPCPPVLNYGANASLFASRNLGKLISSVKPEEESKKSTTLSHNVEAIPRVLPPDNMPLPPPMPPPLPLNLPKRNAQKEITFGAQPFPAVTLCSLNPIKKSLAMDVPELEEFFSHVEAISEHHYNQEKARLAQEKYSINSSMDGMEIQKRAEDHLSRILRTLDPNVRDQLTFQYEDIFKSCAFDGETCTDTDFTSFIDLTFGRCFTFNNNKSDVKLSSRAGPNYGLRLFVVSELDEYIITTKSAGARLVIHGQDLFPFPDTFGYNLPSGSANSVGIRPNRNQRYSDDSECQDEAEVDDRFQYQGDYTVEGCQRTCFQKAALQRCKCIDPKYPAPSEVESCALNDSIALECIRTAEKEERCECPMRCTEPTFDVTISSSPWRVQAGKAICSDANCDQILPSAMLINIFYEHLNQQVFTQSLSYTFINLISDTAGQLGFWIGLSFLGFLEIMLFLIAIGRVLLHRIHAFYERVTAPILPNVVLPEVRQVGSKAIIREVPDHENSFVRKIADFS